MYAEKSTEILGSIAGTDEVPAEVSVDFQFVIYNHANVTNVMYDRFTVVIKSNGQDKAQLCQDYYDDLDVDSILPNVTYHIGSGDEEGW
jgi:hypothetical protein